MLVGALVCAAAIGIVAFGRALAGPADPECGFLACGARRGGELVQLAALPVALYGGVLVAIGITRRFHADEETPP